MTISFDEVRFIKLGNKKDKWAEDCIEKGWLPLGYESLKEMGTTWDPNKTDALENALKKELKKEKEKDNVTKALNTIETFYTLGSENKTILWITEYKNCLYWGITKGVTIKEGDINGKTVYYRTLIDNELVKKWQNHSLTNADEFFWSDIHGEIAQTHRAQNPIHKISGNTQAIRTYLKNLIKGKSKKPNSDSLSLIQALSPHKFEAFITNVLILNGYFLTTVIGRTQKGIDFVISPHNDTSKKIAVQVKTESEEEEFRHYTNELDLYDKVWYFYHTGDIKPTTESKKIKAIQVTANWSWLEDPNLNLKLNSESKKHLENWLIEQVKFGIM
ncbi:MAG: restriction endonuclease [Vampirovibrio sp.]|nr:restriction endonuclease [Vampirovibrio sp.]